MTESFDKKTGFKISGTDAEIEKALREHCAKFNIEPYDAVFLFPVLIRRQNLKRFLAHSQLFLKTLGLPGDIAELGVYRGLGLMTWANLLESYCIGDRTKTVFGFDNWAGFSGFLHKMDHKKKILEKLLEDLILVYLSMNWKTQFQFMIETDLCPGSLGLS